MTHPCTLNNTAACMIQHQQCDEAITTLTRALRTVKLVMSGDARLPDCPNEESQSSTSDGFTFHFAVPLSPQASDPVSECGGCKTTSIMREPLYVSSAYLPQGELQKCELLSYVILYNLALSYHLRGMEEEVGHLRLAYLDKAKTLYEHSHSILSNQRLEISLIFTMAITSNLGHIHQLSGNQETAFNCFQHLLSILLYVIDCGHVEEIKSIDGLIENIMPLIGSTPSAAAA